ncbi:CDP-glycerol glycerophosphotransferase family protein [Treponema sp. C6A8]|uniref:CDP-glycerol glycerophosphotransferase family protein n=1 Tax=Treponema sp. C6A8 TaxID=1410609 RepID=UPI0018CC3A11|nr:CDP-glycerol glycerophosphotransferase family protein [Treponema sp. C6A8]
MKRSKLVLSLYSFYLRAKEKLTYNLLNKKAIKNYKEELRIVRSGKIKIGFLLQDLNVWNKESSIAKVLFNDDRFDVYLICLPGAFNDDRIVVRLNENYNNVIEEYSCQRCKIINAFENNKFIDLRKLKLSYLFYTRPYNNFLPKEYRSYNTSRYLKICYTQYAIILDNNLYKDLCKIDFFRNVYAVYASTMDEEKYIQNRISKMGMSEYQKSKYFGYAAAATFLDQKINGKSAWPENVGQNRIVWTPRWSENNFGRYGKYIIEYAKKRNDIFILHRPHPLTLGTYLQTGKMTEKEVEQYKLLVNSNNSKLDESKEYGATFWQSTLLITDYSSIIFEYFLTGKPIIFCPSKEIIYSPIGLFEEMLKYCYIAKNWSEIQQTIDMLLSGDDFKKNEREYFIKKEFGLDYFNAPDKIVNDIYEDYIFHGNKIRN